MFCSSQAGHVTEGLSALLLRAFVCRGIYFLLKYKKILSEKISIRLGGLFFFFFFFFLITTWFSNKVHLSTARKTVKIPFTASWTSGPPSLPSHQKNPWRWKGTFQQPSLPAAPQSQGSQGSSGCRRSQALGLPLCSHLCHLGNKVRTRHNSPRADAIMAAGGRWKINFWCQPEEWHVQCTNLFSCDTNAILKEVSASTGTVAELPVCWSCWESMGTSLPDLENLPYNNGIGMVERQSPACR